MKPKYSIEFKNVTKYYDSHTALTAGLKNYILNFHRRNEMRKRFLVFEDVSFNIEKGTTVAIVGDNGAGKSTMLSLIAGVLRPTYGEIKVNQRVSSLLELGAGFHPDLSGRENITLYGVLMGFTRGEVSRRMDSIIEFSELHDFIDTPVRFYSSGMLARLGFSIISQLDPQILLVDEVFAVGDFSFQKKSKSVMDKFKKEGKTIIIVSHATNDVLEFCDRAIWISNHRMVMDSNPKKVIKAYTESKNPPEKKNLKPSQKKQKPIKGISKKSVKKYKNE